MIGTHASATCEIGLVAVIGALAGRRFPLEDEKQTQAAIEMALVADLGRSRVRREVRIMGGIIDFLVLDAPSGADTTPGATGIEVKLKGQPREILRQVRGYAWEPTISGLVLVTAKPVPAPADLCGKPFAVLDLGRAWL